MRAEWGGWGAPQRSRGQAYGAEGRWGGHRDVEPAVTQAQLRAGRT